MPLNLIILGPQGSGKGTQAELLKEKFGFVFLGMGDLLREVAQEQTDLGRRMKARLDKGMLVEPEDSSSVIEQKLKQISGDKPVIIEGFPRSIEQYNIMKVFWPRLGRDDFTVIYLDLAEDEAVKRLSKRVMCEDCGRIYIAGQFEKCPDCSGKLAQRHDDYPEAVRNRLGWFKSETLPLIAAMEKDGVKIARIDGAAPIEEVHQSILQKLGL